MGALGDKGSARAKDEGKKMSQWKCRTMREKCGGWGFESLGCHGFLWAASVPSCWQTTCQMRGPTRFPQTLINSLLSVGPYQGMEVEAEKDRASVLEKLSLKEAGKQPPTWRDGFLINA